MNKKLICIIGPGIKMKGGISTVLNHYKNSSLNQKYNLYFISSYGKNILLSFLTGLLRFTFINRKIALVHIHMSSYGSFYRKSIFVIISSKKTPIIAHIHSGEFLNFYNNSSWLLRKYIQYIFKRIDTVIVLSNIFKKEFQEAFNYHSSQVIYIPNGTEIIQMNPITKEKNGNQVLYLGKLIKTKGIYDLLESIPKVLSVHPQTVFHIAGNGDVEEVRKIIFEKKLMGNVKLLGWVEGKEKEKLLIESSILVMPSHYEAFGISIIEAMNYGNVIVASNVGGIPDIVKKDNGILVNSSDVKGLSEGIIFYLNNPRIMKKVSEANISESKKYNINSIIKIIDRLYMEKTI